ncbi:hypothetical protein ACLOJK_041154, partial [Asimina triloba]
MPAAVVHHDPSIASSATAAISIGGRPPIDDHEPPIVRPRAASSTPTSITPAARISYCPDHHNGPGSNDPSHTSCAHRDGNASARECANASTHAVAVCDAPAHMPAPCSCRLQHIVNIGSAVDDRRFTLKAATKVT